MTARHSYDTILRWIRNFQTGYMSFTDAPRSGRPSLTDDAAMGNKVEDFILLDRRATIQIIMNKTDLSFDSMWKIIHEKLHTLKLSAHWVSRLPIPFQEKTCEGRR